MPVVTLSRYNHGRFSVLPSGGKGVLVSTNAHGPTNELQRYEVPLGKPVSVPDAVVDVLKSARYDIAVEDDKQKKGA